MYVFLIFKFYRRIEVLEGYYKLFFFVIDENEVSFKVNFSLL